LPVRAAPPARRAQIGGPVAETGSREGRRLAPLVVLALVAGAPALVYEVVWTRQVALLVGSQVEAISAVLVAFFGGLALGALALGPVADRVRHPLRLYAALEVGAALAALAATAALDPVRSFFDLTGAPFPVAPALLVPATFLLGGTLPALLRSADPDPRGAARAVGWLVGGNTLGAVAGVGAAAFAIPSLGLRASVHAAGTLAFATALCALLLSRAEARPRHQPEPPAARDPLRPGLLAAAAVAGAATLACEVLAARGAGLRLGSSLFAWACVLGLFLAGLGLGNLLASRRAARSEAPATDLGVIELLAAAALAISPRILLPGVAAAPAGAAPGALASVALGVLPAALAMGAAFPFLVRLGILRRDRAAADFGRVSAANTAGGIGGSLLAPFVLLPGLGLEGALLACAAANAGLGVVFLVAGAPGAWSAARRAALGAGTLAALAVPAAAPRRAPEGARVLHVDHGAQASAVVLRVAGERRLLVDGELEAATGGTARQTEELLAALPLVLHPEPRSVLEVGLGSGITLARAARFPVERVVCVEIAGSVLGAARYFAPDNGDFASGADPRVRIVRGDGRAFLASQQGAHDVVLANTVQPWSLGATGLYSREYFGRVARALRGSGLAVQWLPVERIGGEGFAAILRTFFAVFPEGGVWWAAENVLLVGSGSPLPRPDASRIGERLARAGLRAEDLGLSDPGELAARWVASAAVVRGVLGTGELLSDDRPTLELRAGAARRGGSTPLDLVVELARAHGRRDPRAGPLLLWLESRRARAAGDPERAARLETLAEDAGLGLARRSRADRGAAEGRRALDGGRLEEAARHFHAALDLAPDHAPARFGMAAVAVERRDWEAGRRELGQLLAVHPGHAEGWNLLGVIEGRRGEGRAAGAAFGRALEADPFFPEALANAGLLALERGDPATARDMLARLRAANASAPGREEQRLGAALAHGTGGSRVDLDATHP
jgi:spermidine synthase